MAPADINDDINEPTDEESRLSGFKSGQRRY